VSLYIDYHVLKVCFKNLSTYLLTYLLTYTQMTITPTELRRWSTPEMTSPSPMSRYRRSVATLGRRWLAPPLLSTPIGPKLLPLNESPSCAGFPNTYSFRFRLSVCFRRKMPSTSVSVENTCVEITGSRRRRLVGSALGLQRNTGVQFRLL